MTRDRIRPTLADVAKRARVSIMTVSNVVNGRTDLVREETQRRVARAIQKMGYRPQVHARALRLARGWAVGLLVITKKSDFVTIQWMSQLMAGASGYLSEQGYGLLLHNQSPDTLDDSMLLRTAHTDGLIAIVSGTNAERKAIFEKLAKLNQPLVALQEPNIDDVAGDTAIVRQDDFGAGVLIANHLIANGASNLVFVEPDFSWPAMSERIRGIKSVLRKTPNVSLRVIKCKDDAQEDVEATILEELREHGLPDAFLGGNELVALAALATLEAAGYRVPEQVLLTGFNAFELWYFAKRKITTVDFPAHDIGQKAGMMMLERLRAGAFDSRIEVLPATLRLGDTTGGLRRPTKRKPPVAA